MALLFRVSYKLLNKSSGTILSSFKKKTNIHFFSSGVEARSCGKILLLRFELQFVVIDLLMKFLVHFLSSTNKKICVNNTWHQVNIMDVKQPIKQGQKFLNLASTLMRKNYGKFSPFLFNKQFVFDIL